jgi:hypothetical protein
MDTVRNNICPLTCKLCNKKFTDMWRLKRHNNRKIPCNRILQCEKCNKKFKQNIDYKRHLSRKTPCEPIQGDMINKIADNRCRFCGKTYKSKYSLKKHYKICKIKNGGMKVLFNELQKQIDDLKQQLVESKTQNAQQIANDNAVINNHFNTTINIPLICFGGTEERVKMLKIIRANIGILSRPIATDIPHKEQLYGRITEFVSAVHRNPEHKELQNVYTKHDFCDLKENNAFIFRENKWHIGSWEKFSKNMFSNLYNCFIDLLLKKETRREDALHVMKTIFSAAVGETSEAPITDENLQELYCKIGDHLGFSDILLE